jgi:hypothetical protein
MFNDVCVALHRALAGGQNKTKWLLAFSHIIFLLHACRCICHTAVVRILVIIHSFIFVFGCRSLHRASFSFVQENSFVVTMSLSSAHTLRTDTRADASLYYIYKYIYTIIHNYTFTYILKNIPIHDVTKKKSRVQFFKQQNVPREFDEFHHFASRQNRFTNSMQRRFRAWSIVQLGDVI